MSLAEQVARAHDPALQADFFRIAFVPQGTSVDHLARPGALRGFFGASSYYLVPMPLDQVVTYPGLADAPQKVLVALRCKPATMTEVQPVLATWPNVLRAITIDLAEKKLTCPPSPGDAENEAFCIAQHYQDAAGENVTLVLSGTLKAAAELYEGRPEVSNWLVQKYGIYPTFSGSGMSVKDSYTLGPKDPLAASAILKNSISPEYLLRNVSLAEGGCHCIIVPPYPERSGDPVDPEYIWQKGGEGRCAQVDRLRTGTGAP